MLEYITGTVINAQGSRITVLTQNIGFGIFVPERYHFTLDDTVKLILYTHFNQEQGISLYGFVTLREKELFGLIMTCSGFGPKLALTLLNKLSPDTLIQALITQDKKMLSSVEGVGTKKAEQLLLQLKDKIIKLAGTIHQESPDILSTLTTVTEALTSLGYTKMEITLALQHIKSDKEYTVLSFNDLLRKALAVLAKK